MKLRPIKDLTEDELYTFFEKYNEKKFRVKQLNDALYKKKIQAFPEIPNFSPKLIDQLIANFSMYSLKVEKTFESVDGSRKILYSTSDNEKIESVFLPNHQNNNKNNKEEKEERNTLCISTMVGCPVNCSFCATARLGYKRGLTVAEIVDQLFLTRVTFGEYIDNLVLMGMGEPLLNYENVVAALKLIIQNKILNKKSITLSTVGIPAQIIDFANKEIKTKLAISLHSPFDEIRRKLIPITKNYQIEDLLKSLDYYYKTTKLPITFEYILFKGINNRDEDVKKLGRIARRFPSKINLIPFNDISFVAPECELEASNQEEITEFSKKLYDEDIMVIVRKSQGSDIAAACGQLAQRG